MKNLKFSMILFFSILSTANVIAQETKADSNSRNFYVKPYAGFIGIQDMSLDLVSNSQTTNISVENGFGWTSGISFGYTFTKNLSAEIGWEYKTNDVTVIINNIRSTGDYASNFIYVNGMYSFDTQSRLKPYVGLGVSFIEEIDLDFGQGIDTSYSTSGNIGFQGIAGLDFNFSERWALNWEAKYVTFSDFDMENEANDDQLNNLKYSPFIFNIGVKYRF